MVLPVPEKLQVRSGTVFHAEASPTGFHGAPAHVVCMFCSSVCTGTIGW